MICAKSLKRELVSHLSEPEARAQVEPVDSGDQEGAGSGFRRCRVSSFSSQKEQARIEKGQFTVFTSKLLLECSVGSRFDTSIIILFSCRYRRAFF
jgi:hypothetical protein